MKNRSFSSAALTAAVLSFFVCPGSAGTGGTAGLTLLEAPNARAAALGEAYTAATNDVAGFTYNPASLATLVQGNASFLYQKGAVDDAYAHFAVGGPRASGAWGVSLGYYNSGTIDLFDGVQHRSATAEKDLTLAAGYARHLGRLSWGVAGKYVSTELVETDKAHAWAADTGLQLPLSPRVTAGAALQNLGTQLSFPGASVPLPRIARAGLGFALFQQRLPTTLLLDAPYFLQDKKLRPAAGIEVTAGILALRAGYRTENELEGLSLGAGVVFKSLSFDYSFGFVQNLDARQRVSVAMRFGPERTADTFAAARPAVAAVSEPAPVPPSPKEDNRSLSVEKPWTDKTVTPKPRIYVIQRGDTMAKIAMKVYGDPKMWKLIFDVNKKTITDASALEPGQKLVLP